jgi:hypothetical protein
MAIVSDLAMGPLDFHELVTALRQRGVPGVRHVFSSAVAMTLEYLKGHGVVTEEAGDRTQRVLDALKSRAAQSRHFCPAEKSRGIARRGLVSLYAQKQTGATRDMRLVPCGVLCPHCGYHELRVK